MGVVTRVIAPARLHWGLYDLGRATSRTFGGLGVMIRGPATIVEAQVAEDVAVESDSPTLAVPQLQEVIWEARDRLRIRSGVYIRVRQGPPEHIGLGSKTSLVLASLAAATECWQVDPDREWLAAISRRGGTSGIGINGFFDGGLISDAGHSGHLPLMPSSRQSPSGPPPVVVRQVVPADWIFTLFLPPGKRIAGDAEANFFRRETPIDESDVHRAIAIAYQEVVPAVIEKDLNQLGQALERFQSIGFKAREIDAQSPETRACISALKDRAPCVGLSSMGPLVFTISSSPLGDTGAASAWKIGETTVASSGFEVEHD
jgi:beta-ribofuranosylaminobenzene 5'-phosphate synthase